MPFEYILFSTVSDSTVSEATDTATGEKRKQIESDKHKKATLGGDKVETPSRSKHVPHTFLTMPDGKRFTISFTCVLQNISVLPKLT